MFSEIKSKILAEYEQAEEASVISLVSLVIEHAHMACASDIHIDPFEEGLIFRFRVDGMLYKIFSLPRTIHQEVISRIKILSGLRTDEHQSAQDGRFRHVKGSDCIDVRVSIVPTYYGENAVLRLLSERLENGSLETLGFTEKNLEKIKLAVKKPFGMILVTGPTGSGKTTTLYALLKYLNLPEISIVTIEDPIEYSLPGIEQIQVNPKTGLSFANGLRSILRQDPNVIMVGEIRDNETAGIAVNVALTGHLLLSTLHTNDPATTLPRLLDMKIESYLVASTVNIAVGQRLLRKICSHCKVSKVLQKSEKESLAGIYGKEAIGDFLFEGKGCENCSGTGYKGRLPVHEVLQVTEKVRLAILQKRTAGEIKNIALSEGMLSMEDDALFKARQGLTSFEEILRLKLEW
ncbi:MAG: type II/IV secretion system protein [Candidatus Doudnabacteria bacterium]|nr:type II/IV secretion system protein [Candidatus Doudnabacteria bacterium]